MRIYFTIVFIFIALAVSAQETCTLTGSGTSGTATWSCTGASAEPIDMVPDPGNVVIIPATLTYEHTDNNVTWEASILLQEETSPGAGDGGTLIFSSKLNLGSGTGCGYTLTMETGSRIDDSGGGGGSDRLIICGATVIGTGGLPWPPGGFTGPEDIDENGGTLPVELMFFSGKAVSTTVELSWATASEENFDYFSIELSRDGNNFKEIARIYGMGTSAERVDYSYIDESPLAGRSYYRLRSTDFDGYTEVFDYVMINMEGVSPNFSVFPNPASNGNISIQANYDSDQSVIIMVYNNAGRVVAELEISDWLTTFNLSQLEPGNYIFRAVTAEGIVSKNVVVN